LAQSLTGVLRTLLLYIALDILLLQPRSAIGTSLYGGLLPQVPTVYLALQHLLAGLYRSMVLGP
jgi:hypothetical protein